MNVSTLYCPFDVSHRSAASVLTSNFNAALSFYLQQVRESLAHLRFSRNSAVEVQTQAFSIFKARQLIQKK